MKKLQLLEITQSAVPNITDEEGNIVQEGSPEISHVFVENGFTYDEDLCLSKIEPETTEKIIRKKNGEKVPTPWETKTTEEKEDHYFGLRLNAYKSELDRIAKQFPERIFVVKIIEA